MENGCSLTVTIKVGKHSWKPPRGMQEAFHEVLSACEISGEREILMGDIIRGVNGAKKVEVGNFDPNTKSILFYSQPASKDRRHECKMIIPGEFRDNPEEFLNRLYKVTGDRRYVEPPPVPQPEPKTFDFTKKGTGMAIEKSKRRESAVKALEDERILFLIIEHIGALFKDNEIVTNGMVLAAIKKFDSDHKPRSIYITLLKRGYISESDRTPKKAKVYLTEMSLDLLAKHAQASKKTTGTDIEDDIQRIRNKVNAHLDAIRDFAINRKDQDSLRSQLAELEKSAHEIRALILNPEEFAKLAQQLQDLINPAS